MSALSFLLVTVYLVAGDTADTFRFANYYDDNMVLQRAPASASIWGYVPSCNTVSVTMGGMATIVRGADGKCRFYAKLQPTTAGGNYTITATSPQSGSISLRNVAFGDVWVCGGQSNMVFTLPQTYDASNEIPRANSYPNIRLFTVQRVSSETPLDEPPVILQQWSVASSRTVNGGDWQYFSAVCWFYGKYLYDKLKVPIGLVSSNWRGTRIEAWSSPDALKQCYSTPSVNDVDRERTVGACPNPNDYSVLWNAMMHPYKQCYTTSSVNDVDRERTVGASPNPNENSVLWNAMIRPLLNMTIYGAIWYQGEANAGYSNPYSCSFPTMINDWRKKWSEATDGNTKPGFPFGFVQLSAVGTNNQSQAGFPGIRWAQTANHGYVPNPDMVNVFMAVAMDLGDPTSPYGSIHPRFKKGVGYRLSLGARAIAYSETDLYYTGPIADKYDKNMGLSYRNIDGILQMPSPYGFEIGCTLGSRTIWIAGTGQLIAGMTRVKLSFPPCPPNGYKETAIRYSWRDDPCPYLSCAIYSGDLPSPPFVLPITAENR